MVLFREQLKQMDEEKEIRYDDEWEESIEEQELKEKKRNGKKKEEKKRGQQNGSNLIRRHLYLFLPSTTLGNRYIQGIYYS